jgi:hypothetical protein
VSVRARSRVGTSRLARQSVMAVRCGAGDSVEERRTLGTSKLRRPGGPSSSALAVFAPRDVKGQGRRSRRREAAQSGPKGPGSCRAAERTSSAELHLTPHLCERAAVLGVARPSLGVLLAVLCCEAPAGGSSAIVSASVGSRGWERRVSSRSLGSGARGSRTSSSSGWVSEGETNRAAAARPGQLGVRERIHRGVKAPKRVKLAERAMQIRRSRSRANWVFVVFGPREERESIVGGGARRTCP